MGGRDTELCIIRKQKIPRGYGNSETVPARPSCTVGLKGNWGGGTVLGCSRGNRVCALNCARTCSIFEGVDAVLGRPDRSSLAVEAACCHNTLLI